MPIAALRAFAPSTQYLFGTDFPIEPMESTVPQIPGLKLPGGRTARARSGQRGTAVAKIQMTCQPAKKLWMWRLCMKISRRLDICAGLPWMAAIVFPIPALSQGPGSWNPGSVAGVDLAGNWGPVFHEDAPERGPGPELVNYLGIPITDRARLRA